jgi:cyclohexa-1,5-dienecarbonyl-CoA hydratase
MTRTVSAAARAARIRPLVRRDLAGVVRIDAIHTGAEQRAYWTRLFREFLAPGPGRQQVALTSEIDGEVAGFLLADVRAFEFGSEPCGWILEVGVDPGETRRGIASALLAEAVRRLRASGVSTIRTMVRRNDVPVLTFFHAMGLPAVRVQLELVDGLAAGRRRAMAELVRVSPQDAGAFWRVTFGGAKGNIIDRAMMAALGRLFADARAASGLKAVCLEGAGDQFSFGASVQEHLPGEVRAMLTELRQLVLRMLDSHLVLLAAVKGQCLGGGLELASVCHRVFAHTGAKFGQPEIALGVFAPIASIVLPERIGRAHGEDLCLTGRIVGAPEAQQMGLADELTDGDPGDAALAWARAHFAARSASSLRFAVRAVRAELAEKIRTALPELEALYVHELMATHDANEGLRAFLEKRPPAWRHA